MIIVIFASTLAVGSAEAQHFSEERIERAFSPLHESEDGLTISLAAGLWAARLAGDAQLEPGPRLELRRDLNLSRSEPTLNAELAIRKHERWELSFTGVRFSTDTRGVAAAPITFGSIDLAEGDEFRNEFTLTSISAELRFSAFRPLPLPWDEDGQANLTSDGRSVVDLRFMPALGARWASVRHRLHDPGAPAAEQITAAWAVPYAGVGFELTCRPDFPFTDHFRIEAGIGLGPALGSGGGFAWHVRAGVTWHFTPNIGLAFGYRLLDLNVKKDDYHLRGGLQGLFAAGALRF